MSKAWVRPYLLACAAAVLLIPELTCAQTPPDAGSIRQQIEQARRKSLPPKSEPAPAPSPPLESLGRETITVTHFNFVGNTLLSSEQLTAVVASFTARRVDFAELQNAAAAVANAYREAGWIVRAYLPRQNVTAGAITIEIVEAMFGTVRVEGDAKRVSAKRLQNMVRAAQAPRTPVNVHDLDRALLLINDLPGVIVTGGLSPGENHAETNLTLVMRDAALVEGSVTADNAGSRFTGAARVIADASLNGRLGVGDRADALLLYSDGSEYMRLAYSLPFGRRGLRAGLNASHLGYDILTSEFSGLDAHGTSNAAGIEVSYPLLRSRLRNLYLGLDGVEKRFDNKSAGQTSTRYSVQAATLGVYGNLFDSFFGGGANSASIAFVQGNVDLSGSPNEAADALTTRTAGGFWKVRFSASRLQAITGHISLFASLDGQLASKNLDSSEKLYLGGSQGVRAYPENETGGAEGLLLNLEARANVADVFTVTAFLDGGAVHVNKDNDIQGAVPRNSLDLMGAGLSVGWIASFGLYLKATVAQRVGSNPNATSRGDDQDGSLIESRVWLQAGMPF